MLHAVNRSVSFLALLSCASLPLACSKPSAPVAAVDPVASEAEAADGEERVSGVEGEPDTVPEPSAASGAGNSAALLAEATRVLGSMSSSTYSHHTHVEQGQYDVDCSGFVDWLLGQVNPPALAELRALSVKRPLAKHFVAVLGSATPKVHWSRLLTVAELAPGDVIAWEKPADLTSSNTGHVMIVAEPAQLERENRWTIPIIDSSASPHGSSDARRAAHATGIGRGSVVLETSASGEPVAYHWSRAKRSLRHETRIVLARLR